MEVFEVTKSKAERLGSEEAEGVKVGSEAGLEFESRNSSSWHACNVVTRVVTKITS